LKLVVEGWRSVSHSFAVINQWQLLALKRRPEIDLRVVDLPFFNPSWTEQTGLFPRDDERVIRDIEAADEGFDRDITFRTAAPCDLRPVRSGRLIVFGGAEYRVIRHASAASDADLHAALADPSLTIAAPSEWSANAFLRLGFDRSQIVVIPHGVDPTLFRPRPEERDAIRDRLGVSGFVFMSVGAMTGNKGLDILLKAFAALAARRDDVGLLLKGNDQIYTSRQFLEDNLRALSPSQISAIMGRVVYLGEAVSMEEMSVLYQAADAYVSPYRAEAFNLPVLEASACGLPVICTRGGATDDFVTGDFAMTIDSRLRPVNVRGEPGLALEPDVDHLVELMDRMADDKAFCAGAAMHGPRHVQAHYTWDHAIDRMIGTGCLELSAGGQPTVHSVRGGASL
jgi:glycosyltransferase involved in cell wall biosynthesis